MPARAYPIHICGDVVSGYSRLLSGELIKAEEKAKANAEANVMKKKSFCSGSIF
jgi:hypothetical protein